LQKKKEVMLIARQKKQENIAEYVLYMWQIEDIIRGYQFNLETIKTNIIEKFNQPEEVKKDMTDWYDNLIAMMKNEKIEEKGHLKIIKNITDDMNELHMELLQDSKEIQYNAMFFKTLPYLIDFRNKSKAGQETNDVELALGALYGILILRLQKREISKDTEQAIKQISIFLAHLAAKHKEDEE